MAATDDEWRAPGVPVPPSPVLAEATARLDTALDALAGVAVEPLGDDDVARLLDHLTRVTARVAGLTATAVGEADHRRLGDAIGARHTGQWWARRSRLTRPEAGRAARLGRRLAHELHRPVRDALTAGSLHAEQAAVIVAAVDAIPSRAEDLPAGADAPAALKARARDHLLALASDHDAHALKVLGRRVLDIVAPEVGEHAEAQALAREEAAAATKVCLRLRDDGHGSVHGRFTVPVAAGEALRKQLLALADPRRQRATDHDGPGRNTADDGETSAVTDPDDRPLTTRLGWALVEWIETYPAQALPTSGGVGATVVVTMSHDTLLGGLAAASLDTGTRISAGEARRLACEAGILPAVLGGASQVLDLGRSRRYHSGAQRVALALRDGGCTAEGCDLPPAACHAHHDTPWSRGGPTNLDDARLLCHRHHRVIHDPRYDTTRLPDGSVRFHRRT
ncbi:HNH endonuclease signature motif containing protein [Nocardioides sp. Soil805]|uniref:HNH endonuclease signature motif containing protein n=1 Tax=Nocardioides sp. Soil805 TaxID=1736416 RepID=UPI000702C1EF|nr:HNH endonuclease signature motif containing protein [Nocardioides sp. Soil805]KRF36109.1 hypothetical protein ASG94_01065 [Nocardioides sp. Soil805]